VHSDPHPGNILIRPRPGAEHLPQIVIIDHGLYMEQQPQFRRDYASFWHALVMSDQVRLHEVCKRWGIEDIQLFASLQLMKPYKANEDVILSGFTVDDVKGLRGTAKSRAIVMLQQAQAIPEDLVMIGRHLNILRGTNKLLGSPVNRVALMAEYAMRGYHSSQRGSMVGVGLLARARIRSDVFRESMSFHLRMVWLGILYYWITFVRFWQTMLGKEKAQDFDQFMKKEFAQKGFGLKISTDVDIPL
jgi:aarF domain-containing kinase